jgi:hypothetical protein
MVCSGTLRGHLRPADCATSWNRRGSVSNQLLPSATAAIPADVRLSTPPPSDRVEQLIGAGHRHHPHLQQVAFEWGSAVGDGGITPAAISRLLHFSTGANIRCESYHLKDRKGAGVFTILSPKPGSMPPTPLALLPLCDPSLRTPHLQAPP